MSELKPRQSAFGEPCIYPGCPYLSYVSAVRVHLELPIGTGDPTTKQHVALEGGICDLHAPHFLKHLKRAVGTRRLETTPVISL